MKSTDFSLLGCFLFSYKGIFYQVYVLNSETNTFSHILSVLVGYNPWSDLV